MIKPSESQWMHNPCWRSLLMIKKRSQLLGIWVLKVALFKKHSCLLDIQGHIIPKSYCAGSSFYILNDFFCWRVSQSELWLCMFLAPSREKPLKLWFLAATSSPARFFFIALQAYLIMTGEGVCQDKTIRKRLGSWTTNTQALLKSSMCLITPCFFWNPFIRMVDYF